MSFEDPGNKRHTSSFDQEIRFGRKIAYLPTVAFFTAVCVTCVGVIVLTPFVWMEDVDAVERITPFVAGAAGIAFFILFAMELLKRSKKR